MTRRILIDADGRAFVARTFDREDADIILGPPDDWCGALPNHTTPIPENWEPDWRTAK